MFGMESLRILFFRLMGCGLGLDRDLNAIISIGVAGSALETLNAHGGDGRWTGSDRATQAPVKCEPSCCASDVRLGVGVRKNAMQTKTN